MTAQPHDAFFKAAFHPSHHSQPLVHRLFPALESAKIAWETMKGEPTTFIDPALDGHHADLLFSVRIDDGPAYVYFLLEHQSTVDHDMPFRVLVYLVRIWERHRNHKPTGPLPLVIAMVINNVPGGWTGPRSLEGIADLVPHFILHLEDLSHRSNEDLASWALAAFPKAALFALRDVRDPDKLLQNSEHWGPLVAEAGRTPTGMDAVAQLIRYIATASPNLNMEKFRAKIQEYLPKAEAELMTIYEQARQEGLQAGSATLLARLLALKFGEVPSEYAARLRSATIEDIERYGERTLSANTLAEVFAEIR